MWSERRNDGQPILLVVGRLTTFSQRIKGSDFSAFPYRIYRQLANQDERRPRP
ncbi:MAG: hypothetical protein ABGX07_15825 [Pirellulaceae bacterium]